MAAPDRTLTGNGKPETYFGCGLRYAIFGGICDTKSTTYQWHNINDNNCRIINENYPNAGWKQISMNILAVLLNKNH